MSIIIKEKYNSHVFFFPFVCTQSNTHTALIAIQDFGLDRYFGKREKRRFDQVEGGSASEGQEKTNKRNPKPISAAQSERGVYSPRSHINYHSDKT